MEYNCPSCKSIFEFDVTSLRNVLLKFECPSCSRKLIISNDTKKLLAAEEKEVKDRLLDLVSLAMADGVVNNEEKEVLVSRAKEFGVEEKLLEEMLAKQKQHIVSPSSLEIVEEYTEKKSDYLNDKIYDWTDFMLKIQVLNPDHPHLKKYRDDLLDMVSHNAQQFQELARTWEELYSSSNIQSDWEQYREHMEKCLELAKYLRGLHERFLCANKTDFIKLCTQLSTPSEDSW